MTSDERNTGDQMHADNETTRFEDFEEIACEAARAGGELLRDRFHSREFVEAEQKGLHDWVTQTDRDAEHRVVSVLRKRCPDHEVMAEEGSPDAAHAPYRWVVDPLDGTTNFIHHVPTFGVSVGLEGPDGLLAAAIYDPVRDEMFHARRGGGARCNGTPIHCSVPDGPGHSLIATGFPFRELNRLGKYLEVFERYVRSTAGLRRAGAASIDLAYTACGRYDGFFEVGLARWDVAAGTLLVQEAGGVVTDLVGGATHLDTGDIVAASPGMHAWLLEHTRDVFET